MKFTKGQTLYTPVGDPVEFSFLHDGNAYVHPIQTIICQSTNYSGDDYEEFEDERVSPSLIEVDPSALYIKPPIKKLDDEIAARRTELERLKSEYATTSRDVDRGIRVMQADMRTFKTDLERFRTEHKAIHDLGRMLDGQELFPLNVEINHYHKAHSVPMIPDWKDVKCLTIKHSRKANKDCWTIQRLHTDSYYDVRFFDTEEERSECIFDAFVKTCEAFRKKPDYAQRGGTYTTSLDYGTLERWVTTHDGLVIPDDIVAGLEQYRRDAEARRKEKLLAELAGLGGEL